MEERTVSRSTAEGETSAGRLVFPTARFGEITVAVDTLLHFPRGIVGLPGAHRFVFLDDAETPDAVHWLQSVDDAALAFLVCDPEPFFPDYEVELGEAEQAILDVREEGQALVFVILQVPEDPEETTANLRGPLVINTATRTGIQLILHGPNHPARAPIVPGDTVAATDGGETCSS